MPKWIIVLFPAAFAALFLVPCAPAAPPASDAQLQALSRRYLDERFSLHPLEATQLGDHRFDDRLDNLSPAALRHSLEHLKKTKARLSKEIRRRNLSRDG